MKKHKYFGPISIHHLVPRQRMKDYYGTAFHMPRNKLRLWRLRHDAWHVLFRNKTINEIIRYLGNRPSRIYAYLSPTWNILFRGKSRKQAQKLLIRMRDKIRAKYATLELDPCLQKKVFSITKDTHHRTYARIYLDQKFNIHIGQKAITG